MALGRRYRERLHRNESEIERQRRRVTLRTPPVNNYDSRKGGGTMSESRKLAVAGLLVACAPLAANAQAPLTYSSWVPPTHHITIWQANWATEVEKATGGRLKFQSLPKHPTAPQGTFDAVKDGLVDLCFVTASYTPARHILPMMPELPGNGDTSVANSIAYSRMHWKHFHKVGEYNGVKLLGVFTHGPGQMFTKKPIKTLADFKGLKIRSGGGASELVVTALGGTPFFKPAGESFELLKSGVADGIFFPVESIVSFKLETVLAQATLFPGGIYSSAFGFFMNQDKWNKLSKQDQAAVDKLTGEYVARSAGRSWDEADRKGMEAMKKSEIRIVNADAGLIKEVQTLSAPIVEDWIKKASAKGVDARAVLAEFRAELKKVASEK
jgi:TRAP-type C4-dicarboxylate transport system substrate-binding protein